MASGPMIEIFGGFDMQQVVAGDEITITEFNNARLNVDRMLGQVSNTHVNLVTGLVGNIGDLGTLTRSDFDNTPRIFNNRRDIIFGYGVGGASFDAVTNNMNSIQLSDVINLQNTVQQLCALLGVEVRNGVETDVMANGVILAEFWNNLMLNIKDCWDDRHGAWRAVTPINTNSYSIDTSLVTKYITFRWRFLSQADLFTFFSRGGAVGFHAHNTEGSASSAPATGANIERHWRYFLRWARMTLSFGFTDINLSPVIPENEETGRVSFRSGSLGSPRLRVRYGLPVNHPENSNYNSATDVIAGFINGQRLIGFEIEMIVHTRENSVYVELMLRGRPGNWGQAFIVQRWTPSSTLFADSAIPIPSVSRHNLAYIDTPSSFRNT